MAGKNNLITCTVKQYRMDRGWSQETLAQKINIRRQAVYDIESGRYLPNTAVALHLARIFGCKVEDLFVEEPVTPTCPVEVMHGNAGPSTRLAIGKVRSRLVGFPLDGADSIPFGLHPADGLLTDDGKNAQILSPPDRLEKTLILMGCDPAFEILRHHVTRLLSDAHIYCRFASSHRALDGLAQGVAHVAGTHLHNTDKEEANVVLANRKLAGMSGQILGFAVLEEGLIVAKGNPLGIRSVADLAQPGIRFINREPGAALRVLLDDKLKQAGVDPSCINGYQLTVHSHRDGAFRIASNAADAALGLKTVANAYHLDFVPIGAARCDLVIPDDLSAHPTLKILLDVLQSSALQREINALPGYDGVVCGNAVARLTSSMKT